MLKLKFQYFAHLMPRTDSFEKTLMMRKIEGGRGRGRQRMRWLDGITDSMDILLLLLLQQVASVLSDSVRPPRWQPTRLPRPWDSPGKNTGMSCHFLLQYMKVKSESEVAQSCLTLSNPMNCTLPGSSVHGTFQARILEWGAIVFSAMDMSLSNLWELVIDREAWSSAVYGITVSQTRLSN